MTVYSPVRNSVRPVVRNAVGIQEGIDISKPPFFSDIAIWLDASQTDTIVFDVLNYVKEWKDPRLNGRTVVQPIQFGGPESGLETLNGMNVVTFAVNQFMESATDIMQAIGASGMALMRQSGTGLRAISSLRSPGSTAISGRSDELLFNDFNHSVIVESLNIGIDGCGNSATEGAGPGYSSIGYTRPPGGGTPQVTVINEAQYLTTNCVQSDFSGIFRIGKSLANGGMSGTLAEVVYYDRILTPTDALKVRAYFQAKWNY